MSKCEIEDLNVFMGLLEAEEQKETTPIFVKKHKILNQNNYTVLGMITIQIQYDTDCFLQYNYTDNIDEIVEIPSELFVLVKPYMTEEEYKKIQNNLQQARDKMDQQIKTELDKLMQILNSKGFKTVINGVWE